MEKVFLFTTVKSEMQKLSHYIYATAVLQKKIKNQVDIKNIIILYFISLVSR